MIKVLFAARPERWVQYEAPLRAAFEGLGLAVDLRTEFAPGEVEYIVYAPNSEVQDFRPYTRTKAVLNLWAGVEGVVGNETLTQPLARMVGGGLTEGMVEWVTGHVLRHHLGMDAHIVNPQATWEVDVPPLAEARKVTMLGLGALGTACGQALAALGFNVHGWARRPREVAGITTHHGEAGLKAALGGADFAVLLLPDTPATQNVLNTESLSWMARGSFVINPGRGPLIDDAALIASLAATHTAHATLDVFRTEPLPNDHPFWAHPRVTVTPHIASETRPAKASEVIAENIRRGEAGEPFLHLVDRSAGY